MHALTIYDQGDIVSTPIDPYNRTTPESFNPSIAHDEITPSKSADDVVTPASFEPTRVAYGDSDALAWERAFEVGDNLAAPQLKELSFDDDIPASDPGLHNPSTLTSEKTEVEPNSADTAPNEARSAHILTDAKPLAAGATFASAYSATGVTELPHEEPVVENDMTDANPEPPVRESAFSAAGAISSPEDRSDWTSEPEVPHLTDLPDEPASRVWAHIGSIFATLLLVPIVWYLISDSGIRLNLVENNPWDTGHVSITALIEFLGGMIALFVLWLMARASSLGAQIWGALLTLAGLTALIVPTLGQRVISTLDQKIGSFNAFTGNIVHHLNFDLGSGRIAIFGFVLFLTGMMIHRARKSSERRAVAKTVREQILGS